VEGLHAFGGFDGDDVAECAGADDFLEFFVEGGVAQDEAEDDDAVVLFGECG